MSREDAFARYQELVEETDEAGEQLTEWATSVLLKVDRREALSDADMRLLCLLCGVPFETVREAMP